MDNPFVFSKPIEPEKFIGREYELRHLLHRITLSENCLITGQPRIGKTSLLIKMMSNLRNSDTLPIFIGSGYFVDNATPTDFWNFILGEIARVQQQKIEINVDNQIALLRYFKALDQQFVLVVDGIGWLLDNHNFNISFWALLRQITSNAQSLCYAIFTRMNAVQIQKNIERDNPYMGSPVMNTSTVTHMHPFSFDETLQLINAYIGSNSQLLTPKDKKVIWLLSGGHPFLVQFIASQIWDARIEGQPVASDNYGAIKDKIIESTHPHFWDVWRYLSPTAQAIGLMIAIREIAHHRDYDTHELDNLLEISLPSVRELKYTGLVRTENEIPVLSSLAFGIWILQNQVGPGKEISQPETWLRDNELIFGDITRKQIDTIASAIGKIYGEIRNSIVDLGEALARARLGL